jgi:hypothetical protein
LTRKARQAGGAVSGIAPDATDPSLRAPDNVLVTPLDLRSGRRSRLRAAAFFKQVLPLLFRSRPEIARRVPGAFQFDLDGPGGGVFTVVPSLLEIGCAPLASPDVEVRATVATFERLLSGQLDVRIAARQGLLRTRGSVGLLAGLASFLRNQGAT